MFIYIIGIFTSFYQNSVKFSLNGLITRIIPISLIIIFSEHIRELLIVKNNKLLKILIVLAMVLIDVTLNIAKYRAFTLEEVLSLIGNVIFASISVNVFGNYVVKRYGCVPIISYKLITTLYVYIFMSSFFLY